MNAKDQISTIVRQMQKEALLRSGANDARRDAEGAFDSFKGDIAGWIGARAVAEAAPVLSAGSAGAKTLLRNSAAALGKGKAGYVPESVKTVMKSRYAKPGVVVKGVNKGGKMLSKVMLYKALYDAYKGLKAESKLRSMA